MALALGGACANGAPGDQVADVLRRQQVEEFSARRQAHRIDVEQQLEIGREFMREYRDTFRALAK